MSFKICVLWWTQNLIIMAVPETHHKAFHFKWWTLTNSFLNMTLNFIPALEIHHDWEILPKTQQKKMFLKSIFTFIALTLFSPIMTLSSKLSLLSRLQKLCSPVSLWLYLKLSNSLFALAKHSFSNLNSIRKSLVFWLMEVDVNGRWKRKERDENKSQEI